jgi:hypothetical protein
MYSNEASNGRLLNCACVQALAESFNDKRKRGLVKAHGSGYGGSGFQFDRGEDAAHEAKQKGLTVVAEYQQRRPRRRELYEGREDCGAAGRRAAKSRDGCADWSPARQVRRCPPALPT